jgi:pimeloyl-ACP methyl ester carboxylesterase
VSIYGSFSFEFKGKSYAFDLLEDSSKFKIISRDKNELREIQSILNLDVESSSTSIDELIGRLSAKSGVSSLKINEFASTTLSPDKKVGEKDLIENAIIQTAEILKIDPEVIRESLKDPGNKRKIEASLSIEIPLYQKSDEGMYERNIPSLRNMTVREKWVFASLVEILGKTEEVRDLVKEEVKSSFIIPGEMMELESGRQLHYKLTGEKQSDKPTVVMEAGCGGSSIDWSPSQKKLSESLQVLSYDRAGMGRSGPGTGEQTILDSVKDLDELLTKLEEKGDIKTPFQLVGHSYGGACMQVYAKMYPEKVAGIVLVDSSVETFAPPEAEMESVGAGIGKGAGGSPQLDSERELLAEDLVSEKTFASLFLGFVPKSFDDASSRREFWATKDLGVLEEPSIEGEESKFKENLTLLKEKLGDKENPLGELTISIITCTREVGVDSDRPEEYKKSWIRAQETLRERSTNTSLTHVPYSHMVLHDSPETVVKAVQEMFE